MIDLFGKEIPDHETKPKLSPYQTFKVVNRYRKRETKEQRCKACLYCMIHRHNRDYYKCKLIGMSASPATDIRVNHVCDRFTIAEEPSTSQ